MSVWILPESYHTSPRSLCASVKNVDRKQTTPSRVDSPPTLSDFVYSSLSRPRKESPPKSSHRFPLPPLLPTQRETSNAYPLSSNLMRSKVASLTGKECNSLLSQGEGVVLLLSDTDFQTLVEDDSSLDKVVNRKQISSLRYFHAPPSPDLHKSLLRVRKGASLCGRFHRSPVRPKRTKDVVDERVVKMERLKGVRFKLGNPRNERGMHSSPKRDEKSKKRAKVSKTGLKLLKRKPTPGLKRKRSGPK